jgi:hypothetical protein
MFSEDDLIDIIVEAVARRASPVDWRAAPRPASPITPRQGKWGFHVQKPFNAPWTSLPMKRPFVSEHMARQLAKDKKEIRLPKGAILSPLAEEWLVLHGVSVRREGA